MSNQTNRQISSTLERALFTVLLGFLLFFALLTAVWFLIDLLTPVLVGLLAAFICRPLIDWAARRLHFPGWLTLTLLLVLLAAGLTALGFYLVPLLVAQVSAFLEKLPEYIESLIEFVLGRQNTFEADVGSKIAESAEPEKVLPLILTGTAKSLTIIQKALGTAAYVAIYVALLFVFFIAFSLYLPAIKAWCVSFIPRSRRKRIIEVLRKINHAAGVFLRTRLLIALILSGIFSAGWAIAGVPYWLLFGVAAGILNIIPYASGLVWLLVLLVDGLEAGTGNELFFALLWPTVVFTVGQFLDGWVLSPLLQGHQLKISAPVVLFAVVAGGALAGLLGMLLAIPLVAAWQILFADLIKPRIVSWADRH